ncbi:MAG: molybdate ABC transporter permease subunit [Sandaracinus sp.]
MSELLSPALLSLFVALLGAALGLPIAIALGHLLAHGRGAVRVAVSALALLPLALPPVVTGYLLLLLLGRRGLFGGALEAMGVHVVFSTTGAVIASLVVGLPLYVVAARRAFETVDPALVEVARSLGASRSRVLFDVELPLARRGLAAGALLAFARALGEFGATVVLAGDVPDRTRTIPLAVYAALSRPGGEALAAQLAALSVAFSVSALIAHELWSSRGRP